MATLSSLTWGREVGGRGSGGAPADVARNRRHASLNSGETRGFRALCDMVPSR